MWEVKFRAYAENAEVMVYQKDFFKWDNGCLMELFVEDGKLSALYQMQQNYREKVSISNPPLYSTDDMVIITQYTGLKDKCGVEIYNGDIMKWDKKEWGSPFNEIVVWDYELFSMRIRDWGQHCEVIGNIYENMDLIKG